MSRNFEADIKRLAELRRNEAELKSKYATELALVASAVANANAFEKSLREAATAEFDARIETGELVHGELVQYTPEIGVHWRRVVKFERAKNLPLILKNKPELLTVKDAELKELFKAGKATWAVPSEVQERYVILSGKLGDVLIKDQIAKEADASWDVVADMEV
jgi:hypothetical protein